MSTAATDCPACPRCSLPCGSRSKAESHGFRTPGLLMCSACGHEWIASAEDYAQAVAADAAWEAEQAAEVRP